MIDPVTIIAGLGIGAGVTEYLRWRRGRGAGGDASSRVVRPDEFRIDDGVDYRTPPVIPTDIVEQGEKAVSNYLQESRQTYRSTFDFQRDGRFDGPVWMPHDDPLCEWSWSTRKRVLENTHAAYHRNPLAKRAVDVTRQFAVGKGFTLTIQNSGVGEVLKEFIDNPENNVQDYEKTFLQDLQVDGELFIQYFEHEGQTLIVPLPPWGIVEIETDPMFFRRVKRYHLQFTQPAQSITTFNPPIDEWIDAPDMLHVAVNRHSYELRGRPDLFVILPWLRAYKEWLEDRMRQNKWRGALLWWVKISAATLGTIANKAAQYRTPPTPGSMVVTSDKEEWSALSNNVGAPDVSEDGRQVKLMTAVGVGLPEYMLSDGANANLASSTAQQLPALWKFVDAQQTMAELVWTPILQRVVNNAVAVGAVDPMVRLEDSEGNAVLDSDGKEQLIEAHLAFNVGYVDLQSDDPKTLSEALSLDLSNKLVSIETAMQRRGYTPVTERRLMQSEEQDRMTDVEEKRNAAASVPGTRFNIPTSDDDA